MTDKVGEVEYSIRLLNFLLHVVERLGKDKQHDYTQYYNISDGRVAGGSGDIKD